MVTDAWRAYAELYERVQEAYGRAVEAEWRTMTHRMAELLEGMPDPDDLRPRHGREGE